MERVDEIQKEELKTPPRRVRKIKKKKRKKSINWLKRIFIVLVAAAAVIGLLHIDYFKVDSLSIYGNDLLTKEQVLGESKIKTGRNIFDTLAFVEKRRIKKNLYIEDVSIKKKLPDRIIVTVSEKKGVAQIKKGSGYVIIDNDRNVIENASTMRKVTILENIDVQSTIKGKEAVIKQGKKLDDLLALVKAADENDMFFKSVSLEKKRISAYVYEQLKVEGSYDNVMNALESQTLKTVVYKLYQSGEKKGTIHVSADSYCAFKK